MINKKILAVIRSIPPGKVASYGQIAALAGFPGRARHVGWALNQTKEEVPWQRVINARGKISLPKNGHYQLQKTLLEAEGIEFGSDDKIDLKKYGWRP